MLTITFLRTVQPLQLVYKTETFNENTGIGETKFGLPLGRLNVKLIQIEDLKGAGLEDLKESGPKSTCINSIVCYSMFYYMLFCVSLIYYMSICLQPPKALHSLMFVLHTTPSSPNHFIFPF